MSVISFLTITNKRGGVKCNPKTVQYGDPQGYILGPLLCLIFMNYISKYTNQFQYILNAA